MRETTGRWANCWVSREWAPHSLSNAETIRSQMSCSPVPCPSHQLWYTQTGSRTRALHARSAHTYGVSSSALPFKCGVLPLGREQWRTMRYLLCRWANFCLGWQAIYRCRQTLFFAWLPPLASMCVSALLRGVWGETRAVHTRDVGAADVTSTSDPVTPPPNTRS